MKPTTVADLRQWLSRCPDEAEVVLSVEDREAPLMGAIASEINPVTGKTRKLLLYD